MCRKTIRDNSKRHYIGTFRPTIRILIINYLFISQVYRLIVNKIEYNNKQKQPSDTHHAC